MLRNPFSRNKIFGMCWSTMNGLTVIDEEDSDYDQDNYWDPRKTYTGWDYKRRFGEDALKKLYQTREARHRNIVLMEFTRRLPDIWGECWEKGPNRQKNFF